MFKKKNLIWIIGLVIVSVLVYLGELDPENFAYLTSGWILFILILLWLGNQTITRFFDRKYSWIKYGRKRFFFQLFSGILFSLIIINGAYLIFKYLLTDEPPIAAQIILMNLWSFILIIPTYSVYFGLLFLRSWQQSTIEVERYQKETMISQLTNLKNHLDPHFLFNNLNILSSLIDKDTDLSQEFLVRFAQVYRTLLLNKGEDLVTLEEELEFIQSYIFLIETRFENNIQFAIDIQPDAYDEMIPPLTIQMLIENAIKHNIITESRPLAITIASNGERLHVSNTLYEKAEDLKSRSGTGLTNIKSRFKYFSDEELVVHKSEDEFRVSVPLLKIETL